MLIRLTKLTYRIVFVLVIFLFCTTAVLVQSSIAADDSTSESGVTNPPGNVFGDNPDDINFCLFEVGYGPLRLQSQSPFQSLRFSMRALAPSTIQKGEWEVFLSGTLSNVWVNTDDQYLMDYATVNSQASISYGLTSSHRLEIGYSERQIFGGYLDGFIVDFHDAFGFDQAGRDNAPYDDVNIDLRDEDGNLLYTDDDLDVVSRGLEVTLQHNVTCGTATIPAFSYALMARQEMEDSGPLQRDNPVDVGISLATSKKFNQIYIYLAGGYFFYGTDEVSDIKLKKQQRSFLLATEWRYKSTQSLLLQFLASEGQARELDSFSDYAYEITLGWKWEMWPRYVLEVGLIENVIIYDNSPDLGIHLGLSHRF